MKTTKLFKYLIVICISSLLPITANAHHSYAATFEVETIEELEGQVTSLQWKNPHIVFGLQTADGLYQIESHSLSIMRRTGIQADALKVGDRIRVAGNPARDGSNSMFVLTTLLPDGNELIFDPFMKEGRWSENADSNDTWLAAVEDAEASDSGVFRVWSTSLGDVAGALPFAETMNPAAVYNYPLTPVARASVQAFNPLTDIPTLNCQPKGMPYAMEQPYPMEIVQVGENIHILMEEYNGLRVVHMNAAASSAATQSGSLLGYSIGHWDGDTLVVETSRISYPYFSGAGIPLGDDATTAERFTPSDDGKRLDYSMTITNPLSFTEPVTVSKYWLALPGASVQSYVCDD